MANESTNTNENTNNQGTGNENANGSQNTQEQNKQLTTSELEAKIKQLEAENGKLRQANTNASADASKHKKEAAEWKEKYQGKLSEEDRKREEQDEQTATLQKELETLRAERNVANFKSQLTDPAIGFDATLAQEVAEAMNAGDTAKVFDGLRRFVEAHDKSLKENAFRNNQTLQGGTGTKAITKEQFNAMGYKERLAVYNEHPDLYKEYTK